MKIWSRILTFIAVIVGLIAADINLFGINEYKKEIIIGFLGLVFIDYLFTTVKKYRDFTFFQTKYDWIFRLVNFILGIAEP